jgi:hypothetical protein
MLGNDNEGIDLNNDTVAYCELRVVPTVRGIDDYHVGRTRSKRLAQGAPRL